MGMIRLLGSISATAGTPTPVFTGAVTAAVSFSIKNNIATIILNASAMPVGYSAGQIGASVGQQVTLWGFATATYFNGKTVTVSYSNSTFKIFSFPFTHADVASTADTGNTAPVPFQQHRMVRLVCSPTATHTIYVGDGTVSSSQYMAALNPSFQNYVELSGDRIPADRIFIDTDNTGTTVQVSVIY